MPDISIKIPIVEGLKKEELSAVCIKKTYPESLYVR